MCNMPSVPIMASPGAPRKRRVPGRKRRRPSIPNGDDESHRTPSLVSPKPVSLENVVHCSVDKLCEARRVVGQIQEFQRLEAEGVIFLLPNRAEEEERREEEKWDRANRKRRRKVELEEANRRRRDGGDIGETEAVMGLKRTTATMLAHAGFEGG